MMSEQKYIHELHNDHKMWLSEITLAQDQLKSFTGRLEEIARANTSTDVLAHVEKFQNQFIREHEVMDTLIHDIRKHENELVANVTGNTVAVDHRKVSDNTSLREGMETFQKLFAELKNEFMAFVAKTL
ncbi:MAG: hypothetical protein IT244_03180 [Bacteroidia bacterium]|nr:hypothetical protein [Bacteroidia bacterium]